MTPTVAAGLPERPRSLKDLAQRIAEAVVRGMQARPLPETRTLNKEKGALSERAPFEDRLDSNSVH